MPKVWCTGQAIFVDFNQAQDMFDADDFMDTDHLSENGAKKVSGILAEMFGK